MVAASAVPNDKLLSGLVLGHLLGALCPWPFSTAVVNLLVLFLTLPFCSHARHTVTLSMGSKFLSELRRCIGHVSAASVWT